MRLRHATTTLLLASITVIFLAGGCSDEQLATLKTRAAQAERIITVTGDQIEAARATKAEVDAEIATLPPGEDRARLEAYSVKLGEAIERGVAIVSEAETALAAFNARLAESDDALDVVNAGAEAIAPALPVPWGAVLTGVVGLATTTLSLIRARKNKNAAVDIAYSVDGIVEDAIKAQPNLAKSIRKTQGAYAGKLVDEAQDKTKGLPF